jgi:hypothetical protein
MTASGQRTRGQPLVVLLALLLGWTGARVSSLSAQGPNLPEAMLTVGSAAAAQAGAAPAVRTQAGGFSHLGPQSYPADLVAQQAMNYQPAIQFVAVWYGPDRRLGYAVEPSRRRAAYAAGGEAADLPASSEPHFFPEFAHDRPMPPARRDDDMLAAGLPALFTGAPTRSRYAESAALLGGRLGRLIGNHARWSMDAWALIRKDPDKAPPAGTLPSTYGASQAGAVLRYRLAMQNARQPTAYLRTTSTLGALTETSAALGLSARPLPQIPIVAAVEGRLTQQGGSHRLQPVAMAVTTLPPLALPGALRAEVYGQAGYVAGRYATPFADGQVRVDRPLLDLGRAQARVGAGAWGGIQKGASRLDAGPGATVSVPLTPKVFGRLAVDWRFRVAGDAEPDSGPALTLAAGF